MLHYPDMRIFSIQSGLLTLPPFWQSSHPGVPEQWLPVCQEGSLLLFGKRRDYSSGTVPDFHEFPWGLCGNPLPIWDPYSTAAKFYIGAGKCVKRKNSAKFLDTMPVCIYHNAGRGVEQPGSSSGS